MKITDLKEFEFYIGNTTDEDCEGLSDVLYSDASLAIEDWWEENYE